MNTDQVRQRMAEIRQKLHYFGTVNGQPLAGANKQDTLWLLEQLERLLAEQDEETAYQSRRMGLGN